MSWNNYDSKGYSCKKCWENFALSSLGNKLALCQCSETKTSEYDICTLKVFLLKFSACLKIGMVESDHWHRSLQQAGLSSDFLQR